MVKGNVVGHRLNFSAHKSLKRQSLGKRWIHNLAPTNPQNPSKSYLFCFILSLKLPSDKTIAWNPIIGSSTSGFHF